MSWFASRVPRLPLAFGRLCRLFVRLVAVACLGLLLAVGYLWYTTPIPDTTALLPLPGSSRIVDAAGQLIAVIPDQDGRRALILPIAATPQSLIDATIAIEDRSFFVNPGVEPRAILRAALANLSSGTIVEGGSTLTQQLARTVILAPELANQRSIERKLRELTAAVKLTATLPKARILELYLNTTSYTGAGPGVETAARHLFGKSARDLTLAESALLAGLPQAPGRYDPYRNLEAARARQGQVLYAMLQAGLISADAYEAARAERLQLRSGLAEQQAPHFVAYVLAQLEGKLDAVTLARGGVTITTTLDLGVQSMAQAAVTRQVALLSRTPPGQLSYNVHNGAAVVLRTSDGAIQAMVGSHDYADSANAGEVNATLALRQPGSALKPITYAAALEQGWTPASQLLDIPSTFATREGHLYAPENFDRSFHGPLSLREALATSSNVAAVRLLDAVGIPTFLALARDLGLDSFAGNPAHYGLAITLGGQEVRLLDLTAVYATFGNTGLRVRPYAISAISGRGGRPIFVHDPPPPAHVISPQTAYLISDILADRYARLRVFGAQGPLDVDRPAAVKTGTTTDLRDNWTLGYTPALVVGVWVGNADGRPMKAVSGLTGAGPIWQEIMLAAHRGLPSRPFPRPPGVVEIEICAGSNALPSPACPATRRELFNTTTAPSHPDATYVQLAIDARRGCILPAGVPGAVLQTYRLLPQEAAEWAVQAAFPQPPTHACTGPGPGSALGATPRILSPHDGTRFARSPAVAASRQAIAISAAPAVEGMSLTIVVDGHALATLSAPPYRVIWRLTPGVHRVYAEEYGPTGTVRSPLVEFIVE